MLGNLCNKECDVVADEQFVLRRIVKNVKRDLVAKAVALQESVRGDLRKDRVEPFGQSIRHGPTWMHRRTYFSSRLSKYRRTSEAMWTACKRRLRVLST